MTALETLATLLGAGGPLIAKGIIVRRPWIVRLLQAIGLERSGVALLQKLRRRYGEGPVMMRLPFREQAILLSADHVRRVLEETPEPFQSDSSEKHATLAHFEPNGSLISRGTLRAERRALSDLVLQSGCPVHALARRFSAVVDAEISALLSTTAEAGHLSWGAFKDCWFRIVRRCMLGDAAADDKELTAILIKLRGAANWAFLRPKRKRLRADFLMRLTRYVEAAEPGTLAANVFHSATVNAAPADQMAQWLFAFDAAGIATFRALAVLASNKALMEHAGEDVAPTYPFLRACLLETVRLWPTTPAILRQTDRETRWGNATMPAGTGVLIHVPFLHRDDERMPFANRFAPEIWLEDQAAVWTLIPFSGGQAECPARNLVLLLASMTLVRLIARHRYEMPPERRLDPAALPATFDQFSLSMTISGKDDVVPEGS